MSYNLKVTVAGGEAQVEILTPGSVPDGVFQINGHDDAAFGSIAVSRHDDTGRTLAHAHAQVARGE